MLGVWKMEEALPDLCELLSDSSLGEQAVKRFTSPHRQLEWLSVRVLLYHLLKEKKEICYYSSGKPYLNDGAYYISISHTKGYVAVILGKRPVGVDIEQYGQRVHKVAHKYMREDEAPVPYHGDDTWSLLLHWSAKEVMFKCMDTAEVDFRRHLYIEPFTVQRQGMFRAQEYKTEQQRHFIIHYLIRPDFVLTWQVD
ncbi:siderophore (surfactin) biosynthesis regulatory protein [Bacteroides helcogenes P 36-108]|uniref:Siderophore (Surfactin) biosynthesis regulatory protein n=1 Tax=Bacteroides helcogenes (strain ATCC 35417 / DSM 20613 / JCM 6297 / CCUG 15421 / P 36-108) TaxID=693979 RepID=E6SPC3_BACT6|nr:siderophore (surfactin) biosynthesis regulatory protein [Bacteroides helcogenes P 36-108]